MVLFLLSCAGGRLVYGVCTMRAAETAGVVSRFLEAHPQFSSLAGGFVGPWRGGADGFFMFALQRALKKNLAAKETQKK